jgi:hypothetical protein
VIVQSNQLCEAASGAIVPQYTNIFCGTNTAVFEVRRMGSISNDLTVLYAIRGTASNGVDYVTLPGSVTIPAGRRSARVVVIPIDDTEVEGIETVILALTPSPLDVYPPPYKVGCPGKAAAIILDNDTPPPPPIRLPDGSFHVTWPATLGSGYRIESSPDLQNWTLCLSNVVTGPVLNYVDPDASSSAMQFYRVVEEPALVPEP